LKAIKGAAEAAAEALGIDVGGKRGRDGGEDDKLQKFLKEIGLEKHMAAMKSAGYDDVEEFKNYRDVDLEHMRDALEKGKPAVPAGHIDKIARAIQGVIAKGGYAGPSGAVPRPAAAAAGATPPPTPPRDLTKPVGTRENPISIVDFVKHVLPALQNWQQHPEMRFRKVVPTMVLFPNEDELNASGMPGTGGMQYQVPDDLKTILQVAGTGQLFEEALLKCHGKALLLNLCSPSLEVYPKDKEHCEKIYDMAAVTANVVPEADEAALLNYLVQQCKVANPLRMPTLQVPKVFAAMKAYRKKLGRDGTPWRLAYNRADITAVGIKAVHDDISRILQALGRDLTKFPYRGERLYRQETFSDRYEWGLGDYILMDIDPATNTFRHDKTGQPLVRTVNGDAFETTYGKLA
jgi:hypothetical protein